MCIVYSNSFLILGYAGEEKDLRTFRISRDTYTPKYCMYGSEASSTGNIQLQHECGRQAANNSRYSELLEHLIGHFE